MANSRLKIHDDGKEKYESFEAHIYDENNNSIIVGYGADKEEAILNLRIKIDEEIVKVNKLKDIDFTDFDWITWDGKIIDK